MPERHPGVLHQLRALGQGKPSLSGLSADNREGKDETGQTRRHPGIGRGETGEIPRYMGRKAIFFKEECREGIRIGQTQEAADALLPQEGEEADGIWTRKGTQALSIHHPPGRQDCGRERGAGDRAQD